MLPDAGSRQNSLPLNPRRKAVRARPAVSLEHRLLQAASRQNLAVEFDRELQKANGDYIALRDNAGQVLYSGDLCVVALTWLAARARKQGGRLG